MRILEVNEIDRSFGGLHAVNKVSFGLEEGMIKAVIGPNGAGKTTLFNLISGVVTPSSGKVLFCEEEITGLPPYQIAGRGIIRTFQNPRLSKHMTVLENVMIGRHIRSHSGFLASILKLPSERREERSIREEALKALELLHIADYKDREVSSLPFGLQRSVEFARALACEPSLLLLDEPASGLNLYETKEIALLIREMRDKGITILLVEHDMGLVMDISDEIVVLNFGKKIAEDKPYSIQRNSEVIKIYLGDEDA
ncbi:MAG: ABC transporter ATP-binding protein [Clostridiales bacterium]|nr:ABC transporter ATP-binding protein [Clostridiales bacterium]